jgi:hypothetical protein
MKATPLIVGVLSLALMAGCAHQKTFPERYTFSEMQVVGWRTVAVQAANSVEEWARVGHRTTTGPFRFDTNRVSFNLDVNPREVDVIIPCVLRASGPNGQPFQVRVRLFRMTWAVLSMEEDRDFEKCP